MSNFMREEEGIPFVRRPDEPRAFRTRQNARLCRLAQDIASATFDIPVTEIRRANRSVAPTCEARHAAMYLAHVAFQVPLMVIAKEFGRDRTSVAHAVRRIEDRRDEREFDRKLDRVEALAQSCLAFLAGGRGT